MTGAHLVHHVTRPKEAHKMAATKTTQLDKVQARATRRKYRRNLEAMNTHYAELTKLTKPGLVKAMKEAGSKAAFQNKDQAISVILSAEFGSDVFARYDAKVLHPEVKEEKALKGKASKAPKGKASKAKAPVVEDEVPEDDGFGEEDEDLEDLEDEDEDE
jgi:hypothetical protein